MVLVTRRKFVTACFAATAYFGGWKCRPMNEGIATKGDYRAAGIQMESTKTAGDAKQVAEHAYGQNSKTSEKLDPVEKRKAVMAIWGIAKTIGKFVLGCAGFVVSYGIYEQIRKDD